MSDKPIFDYEKAEQYCKEADIRIRGLLDFIHPLYELKDALRQQSERKVDQCLLEIRSLKEELSLIREQLQRIGAPEIDEYERRLHFIQNKLAGTEWPQATPAECISRSPEAEDFRAKSILDLIIPEYVKGLRFLEVGCGNGLVCKAAYERGARVSVGIDSDPAIKWSFGYDPYAQLVMSHDLNDAQPNKPYDIVLMYDVLDHSKQNPVELLHQIKDLMSQRGRIYLRTHPWCSRHGSHLYQQINKAYLHLVLNEVELARVGGYHHPFVRKITHPLKTYRNWFAEAGFLIRNETIRFEEPEAYFFSSENLAIRNRIVDHWKDEDPKDHMGIEYVDYMLEADPSYNIL